MEIGLIILTTLAGYLFNKDSDSIQSRKILSPRISVSDSEIPNSTNIYNSSKIDAVNELVLQKSLHNYKDAQIPAITGVISPIFNSYGVVGDSNVNLSGLDSVQMNKMYETNKTDPTLKASVPFVDQLTFKGTDNSAQFDYAKFGQPSSETLINITVPKMIPFFGGSVKQNVETFANSKILNLYTGAGSTDTCIHKK